MSTAKLAFFLTQILIRMYSCLTYITGFTESDTFWVQTWKKIISPLKKEKKKEHVIKTIMLMSLIYEVNKTILASISRLLR